MPKARPMPEAGELLPRQIAHEIDQLMTLLRLKKTDQLAAILRNPGAVYPSAGLIRTMRIGRQLPSEKFVELLRTRRAEIDAQLQEGLAAMQIGGQIVGVYQITPKKHLHPVMLAEDLAGENVKPGDMANVPALIAASLAVPRDWVAECAECGRPFLRRNSQGKYCYRNGGECRKRAKNERRRQQKINHQDVEG